MLRIRISISICLLALFSLPVSGQDPVLVDFVGGGGPFDSFFGSVDGDVVGYRFTADSNISITHLGIQNDGRTADGQDGTLDSAHLVGLWRDSDQALLCDVTVDSSGLAVGEFFYTACSSEVPLTAGGSYTLGAMYVSGDGDTYFSGPSSVTLDSISATNGVSPDSADLGFVYPTTDSTNLGRVGPNALFVPEPASWSMLCLGLLFLLRRR